MIKKLQKPSWLLLPVAAALMAAGATANVYGATAAGTEIKNLATVSYDDIDGNSYTAQSNEAVVIVAQVFSATINSTDTNLTASAGQPVDISYTLQNTGNGQDSYTISAIDGIVGGDTLDADSITIYEDVNNNGQADSGEPIITNLTLASDEIKSIVVRVDVPNNAITGDGLGITLTAQAEEGTPGAVVVGSVTDLTASKGPDTTDDTVESLIELTGDAVIVSTKNSIHDVANNQITYTVTVKNNGNTDAATVELRDAIPTNTTFIGGSATTSGLLASNGDTVPAPIIMDEAADGIDYNGDGDIVDTLAGIGGIDAVLPINATVTITYTVTYDPAVVAGGTVISNVAYISADVDGDPTTPDVNVSTNQVNDTIGDTLLVSITDTFEGTGGDGINDGQDDDGANDVQLVDQASSGDAVIFSHIVTNNGNISDVLELSVVNTSFPAGTVFTFWNADQTVQLADSNGANGVDVGVLDTYESTTISVIAQLPAGFDGVGPFEAEVTVTSASDPTIFDTVTESLSVINSSTIDIHNSAPGFVSVDDDPIGTAPYAAVNTIVADKNTTVDIPLFIDNDDDAGNAYLLNSGSVYDAATKTVGNLPTGWTVEFFEVDPATGLATGTAITTTAVIPGKTLDYPIMAVVSIPSDQTKAVDNFVFDNDADGIDDTLDGNNDGDGDYPIFFQISSTNTGASDVTMEAIDVNSVVSASLTPNGFTQIDPGGSETYANTLTNNGNAQATYLLTYTNSEAGWSSALSIDTDGDGVADTILENLVAGNILVAQPDGTVATVEVAITPAGPEFTLEGGESLPISATVFAPATAPNGEIDAMTIVATDTVTGVETTAQNQTQVSSGKVRIDKAAALDIDCDGTADTPFSANQPTQVEPNQCVVWRIVAENQGSDEAFNVQVRDAAPSFTTFVPGSLSYCVNQNCTLAAVTDVVGDDEGEESLGDVVFYVGSSAVPATGVGGTLISGNQATVQFSVKVD